MNEQKRIILPGVVTMAVDATENDWQARIREADRLGIREVALFLTFADRDVRRALYRELEKSAVERTPFVHLRTDMDVDEIRYLMEMFGAELFNVHTEREWPPLHEYTNDIRSRTYVENGITPVTQDDVSGYAGLCIDFTHWKSAILSGKIDYDETMRDSARTIPVGACHVSAIVESAESRQRGYDVHHADDVSNVSYIYAFRDFIPDMVAIELDNPLEEQLRIKEYLESILVQ